jgi:hypothetical protein
MMDELTRAISSYSRRESDGFWRRTKESKMNIYAYFLGLATLFAMSASFSQVGAQEQSCSSVRLDIGDGPLAQFPTRNQGAAPLCDYYAACQIVNSYNWYTYRSKAQECSPEALGAQLVPVYNKISENRYKDMGDLSIEQLLRKVDEVGSCDEAAVLLAFQRNSTKYRELSFQFSRVMDDPILEDKSLKFLNPPHSKYGGWENNAVYAGLLGAEDNVESIAAQFAKVCNEHTSNVAKPSVDKLKLWEISPERRMVDLKKSLDSALDRKNPTPPAIRFCMTVLKNKNIVGVAENGKVDGKLCSSDKTNDYHVAVIVGRRWDRKAKECQYLVKNSHGKACDVDKSLDCENGKTWVPLQSLKNNTSTVIWATWGE